LPTDLRVRMERRLESIRGPSGAIDVQKSQGKMAKTAENSLHPGILCGVTPPPGSPPQKSPAQAEPGPLVDDPRAA